MKVIVVGCGRLGAGLALNLTQRQHTVTVIDKEPAAFKRLGKGFKGRTIEGIGIDRDVLLEAGIEKADGLAATTNSDESNVVVARIARQMFQVPRVVARLYDPQQAELYSRLGLQTICTTTWGINRINELLCHSRLDAVMTLGSVDVVEVEIPPQFAGRTVNQMTVPGEITVFALTRNGNSILPTLGTVFVQGDLVHLAVLNSTTDRLNTMLALA